MKAPLYTQDGKQNGEITLPENLFNSEIKKHLVHLALVRQHANARLSTAHTLRRGEVRGSTIKIMRQKGSGRARKGDKRSSILRGGGVAWGPRNEKNYQKELPKKARRAALASSLTEKAKKSKILVLEAWQSEHPKTKEFKKLRDALPASRSVLVIHHRNEALVKSSRNLQYVKPLLVNLLNIHDLLKYDQVLFEKAALEEAEKIFTIKAKSREAPLTKKSANAGIV